jgi:hypothetical protein
VNEDVPSDVPFLDRQLTAEQAAEWQQIPVSELMKKHRAGIIVGFKSGHKTIRWNPRCVIAQQAKRGGMSLELIAASFGVQKS